MHELRRVQYTHIFFHGDDEPREGSLLTFLYDLPYFPPCGVFPPFHLPHKFLSGGTCGGGMSLGAERESFTISEEEYTRLVEAIETTPLDEIKLHAHHALKKPLFEHEFDAFQNYLEWLLAVCGKHGKHKLPDEARHQLIEELRNKPRMESE